MRSLVARTAPAIVFAVGAIMLGNLANADAAPKKWDQEGYGVCAQQAYDDWSAGKITTKTYKELAQGCCQLSGESGSPISGLRSGLLRRSRRRAGSHGSAGGDHTDFDA